MAFVLADRVQETSTTTGTGTLTLAGAAAGYQAFSAVGDGNSTFYGIVDEFGQWENGIGTYTSSGTTLSRTTVLSSSNSNSLVNFTTGTKNVFVTYPAEAVSPVRETAQASTSGTVIDFTGIPVWAKQITAMLQGVSTNANNNLIIQLGTSSGYTTSGYLSSLGSISSGVAGNANATNGFIISSSNSSSVISGIVTISNLTGNTWVYSGTTKSTTVLITYSAGDISLAGALTQIRVQDTAGTGQFDAGTINIMYS